MVEWEKVKVGDIGKVITGKTPKTSNSEYYGGNIPFLTPSDDMSVKYVRKTNKYITEMGRLSIKNATLPANAICVSCIGSDLGKVVITTQKTVTNQQINSIVVDTDKFDIDFVYYSMLELGKILNFHSKTSTAVPIVNKSSFSQYEIDCPKLNTQKKIGAILSSIDKKIEENNQINKNLEQQARSLFKAWFVDFDPFANTMLSDWKKGKLKDVLKLKRQSIKTGENTTLPYLPIDVIPMRTFALTDFKPNAEAQSSLITFDKDDIIIGAMRVYFHRVVLAPCDGITRTTCFTLAPYNNEYLSFALLCCDQESSIDYAQSTSKGSTMPYAIWEGGLGDMEIIIPTPEIAKKFNEIVLPMLRQIQNSYFENNRLREIRDALLPRLMSGEVDVANLDL